MDFTKIMSLNSKNKLLQNYKSLIYNHLDISHRIIVIIVKHSTCALNLSCVSRFSNRPQCVKHYGLLI